jgi:hypothetical protein
VARVIAAALRRSAAKAVRMGPRWLARRGRLDLVIAHPAHGSYTITLLLAGKRLARSSRTSGGQKLAVRLKLARSARRRLEHTRRGKLSLSVTWRGNTGPPLTVRQAALLKR